MSDFLKLFFGAARYSLAAITNPAADSKTRLQQRAILTLAAVGSVVFGLGVVHIIRFDFRGSVWVWLLIGGAACWGIAACIGISLESRLPEGNSTDST